MSGPIGHTFMYNIIILFIVIVFAFLSGTLSYYKAYKVNNKIIYSIEKFEGYNELSKEEIERSLHTLGYTMDTRNDCPINDGGKYKNMYPVMLGGENFRYCIYIDKERPEHNGYYTYGVLTYMNLNLPLISEIDIPVFTRSNHIYKFTYIR